MQERGEAEKGETDYYARYRARRMRELDREYENYRRHKQDCFNRDFDAWRHNRKDRAEAVEEPHRSEAKADAGKPGQ